jgi:hypothetical protein
VEAVRLHFFELEEFYLFSRVSFESAVVGHQQDLLGGVFIGDVEGRSACTVLLARACLV